MGAILTIAFTILLLKMSLRGIFILLFIIGAILVAPYFIFN